MIVLPTFIQLATHRLDKEQSPTYGRKKKNCEVSEREREREREKAKDHEEERRNVLPPYM